MYSILHSTSFFYTILQKNVFIVLSVYAKLFSLHLLWTRSYLLSLAAFSGPVVPMTSEGTGTKTPTITTFPFSTAIHLICVSSSWFWRQTSKTLTTAKTTELFKDYSSPSDYYRLVVINVLPRHTQAGRTSSSHTHCSCVTRKDIESIISRLSLGIQDYPLLLLIS